MTADPIVAAMLREGGRLLLCHRSPGRRWFPNVWDLPGGHVEAGEQPAAALVRELREELGIEVALPVGPPRLTLRDPAFRMEVWLIEQWHGTPVNAAPEEHDTLGWFRAEDLAGLSLAHVDYRVIFSDLLG